MTSSMKLYYMPGACPLVPQIVMEWAGQDYTLQEVPREELKSPWFLEMNPLGSVPVLIDGDRTLTQNAAIVEYLNELHPQAGLHGQDIVERTDVRRWFGFCNADVHPTFAMVFGIGAYSDDPDTQEMLLGKVKNRLRFLFGIADKQLEGKQWLTGRRSIADPYLFVLTRWAKAKDVDLSGMNNLEQFFANMNNDPGVQTALQKQGLS